VSAPRTYGRLGLDRDKAAWIAEGVEPHVVIKLKKNFGHIPEAQGDRFRFRHTPHVCTDLDWFMNRYPLAISPADLRALRGQVELERILSPDWTPPAYLGLREGEVVRPYQAQAVETCVRTGRLLLGDDVGLGKTYTAIALMLQPGMLPAAVVVEPHLAKQWKTKIEAFSTLRVHIVEKASAYSLPKADVYIFKYSNVRGWTTVFGTGLFKCVVYDEIQNLRTGTGSSKGQACTELSRQAATVMAMSATPIFGMGIEMHAVTAFLAPDDHPLGSKDDFQREWCTGNEGRVKDPRALGTHLRERHLMIRRTKGDVGQQMDRINTVVEEVPYDLAEEKAFEDLTRTLAIRTLSAGAAFERGRAARELDLLMRQVTGVAKAASVAAYVRMLLEASDRSVLLVGWHRSVYDIWLKELADHNPVMYTGSESPTQKQSAKEDFVAGRSRLMIMSLGSGSGVDGLQEACSTLVIGEFAWSSEVHKQLAGRLDREGQREDTVDMIYLHADGGSDPPMIELLGIKADQSRGIVDPSLDVSQARSEAHRIRDLAREYLRKRGIKVDEAGEIAELPPPPVTGAPGEEAALAA